MFLLALLFSFLAVSPCAFAGDCARSYFFNKANHPPAPQAAFQQADAVFVGEVISTYHEEDFDNYIQFRVERAWKGVYWPTVVVYHACCEEWMNPVPFSRSKKWLVYAKRSGGNLFTDSCSRTTPLESAQKDLNELGMAVSPRLVWWGITLGLVAAVWLKLKKKKLAS